jgi:hypothetical protein
MLIAASTNMMRGFSATHFFFYGVSKRTKSDIFKFIALLICIPCFQISHLFFKFAYTLNQRRLLTLCGEDLFLQLYNSRISNGSVVDILQSLRQIKHGLERADTAINLSYHRIDSFRRSQAPETKRLRFAWLGWIARRKRGRAGTRPLI